MAIAAPPGANPVLELLADDHPARFWQLRDLDVAPEAWEASALEAARQTLGATVAGAADAADVMVATLGEGQFGSGHWRLAPARRSYYRLKPLIPHTASALLRRLYSRRARSGFPLSWPLEERLAETLWRTLAGVLRSSGRKQAAWTSFWPGGAAMALVLTHDVETAAGHRFMVQVADLEEGLGLRSSFNVVPERYPLDWGILRELQARGFEVGVHGLHHDGHLFDSRPIFLARVERINAHLAAFGADGFRSPLTHRNPLWMQDLHAGYDASFFDTDPFEPQPGGTMSLWPFFLGHLVELPYTLPQDFTMSDVVRQPAAPLWLAKARALRRWQGMALSLTHPDYLLRADRWEQYRAFLQGTQELGPVWHALPREVAAWWRIRATGESNADPRLAAGVARLVGDELELA